MAKFLFMLAVYCTYFTVWCGGCHGKYKVSLYEHKDFKGESQTFEGDGCNNLNGKLENRPSSLKIESGCVQVYDKFNCGSYLETFSSDENVGRPSYNNFKGHFLQDIISSVGPCSCGGKFKITLYEHKKHKGQQQVIETDKCQNVDAKMNDKTSSITAAYGCVKTYRDPNCKKYGWQYSDNGNNGYGGSEDLKGYDGQDAISSVGPC